MTADQLLEWRARLGFTQAEAALKLGIERNTLRVYERGQQPVPVYIKLATDQLQTIARRRK